MMIKAVVFDMDGLMFDTETVATRSWLDTARDWDVEISDEFRESLVGLNARSIRRACVDYFGGSFDLDGFLAEVSRRFVATLDRDGVPEKKGLHELLDWLRAGGYRIGLATSSDSRHAKHHLAAAGVLDYFDALVCGEMVKEGKPAPEIYATAAAMLHMSPGECAALDDSPAGIRSASSAGLAAVMIPDRIAPPPDVRALAAAVLDSLLDVPDFLRGR